jgi:hypothetical protein
LGRKAGRPRRPALTVAQILSWADAYRRRTGQWPNARGGPVVGEAGETWKGIESALSCGRRGLPRDDTLYRLLRRERGLAESRRRPPDLARRAEVSRLRADGVTLSEIGRRLGVTRQAVSDMLRRIAGDDDGARGRNV